jgi:hypothetical protein
MAGFRRGGEKERLVVDNGWRSRPMLPDEYRPCQGKGRVLKGVRGKGIRLRHVGRCMWEEVRKFR